VPFCAHRCDYCDFATWTDRAHLIDDYVDACVADLARWYGERPELPDATSVFFGGGTPSLLPPAQLTRILDAIRVDRDRVEVTVECNPDRVSPEHFTTYVRAGVNRVSFGMQSDRPHVLQALGRTHDRDNVRRSIDAARAAGIERVNVDLIYGTPGESIADWEATLDAALELEPEHVSAYALTVEPGTPLGARVRDGESPAPDDDDQATKYELADARLAAEGFDWYEISNWARPGEECRHNLLYWTMGEYLPIGGAAHGHLAGRRFWNVRTPERYIAAVGAGRGVEAGSETLDPAARSDEAFTLALRTRAGAPRRPGTDPVVDELAAAGLVEALSTASGRERIRLTRTGRLLANDVTLRLLALDTIEC
jgi:oxygen-independent coproporphyrinogen-3 oxidase